MTHIIDRRDVADLARSAARRARWARIMSGATLAGIAIAVIGTLWVWTDQHLVRTILAPQFGLAGQPVTVTPMVQLTGIALSVPPIALLTYLLLQARAVFSGFAHGVTIGDLVAVRVRRIGWILVIKGLLTPFWRAAASVILTLANPSGHRAIALNIGLDDILWAIVGGLLVAIGWTLREAARIAEENASFV